MRRPMIIAVALAGLTGAAESVYNLGSEPARYAGVSAVEDADATGGVAYKTTKGVDGIVHFAYSWETMGVFEATFRLKVADNSSDQPVVSIRYICETAQLVNLPQDIVSRMTLKGTDFSEANRYQTFTVRWLTPHVGRNGWAVNVTGEAEVWLDSVSRKRVRDITENELFGYLPDAGPLPEPKPRHGRWRVHIMRGFFSDYYLLDLALPRLPGLRIESSSWTTHGSCARQPASPEALDAYDLLVLAGTDISHISIPMRLAIVKWVEAGGSLLMLGGPASYAQAGLAQSVLGDLLPVATAAAFDLRREPVTLSVAQAHPIVDGLTFAPPMTAQFRHDAKVREGDLLVLGSAAQPVLAVGQRGKGRVACLLTPPMGTATDVGQVFWLHPQFPELVVRVAAWLITRPAPAELLQPPRQPEPSVAARTVLDTVSSGGLELEGDLDDLLATTGAADTSVKLTTAQLQVLLAGGGEPAVEPLLRALPNQTDPTQARRIEWAVRPYVGPQHWETLAELGSSMLAMVKESSVALFGKSNPDLAQAQLRSILGGSDERLRRAACRSILEGRIEDLLPELKVLQPQLRDQVRELRDRKYEGYWFSGVRRDDPLFTYAEVTMALLAMGREGYLNDAAELMLILHLQDIKVRSFIFLYNPKVPREADMAERHRERNAFIGPDLQQLLDRFEVQLSELPAALHEEFRQCLLAVDDAELMLRLLRPAYYLMATNDTPQWQAFRAPLEAHALATALAARP